MATQPIIQIVRRVDSIDAEYHLNCVSGAGNGASNASRLIAGLTDRGNTCPIQFAAKRYDLVETLEFPQRSGLTLRGVGGCGRILSDGFYATDRGGTTTRLVAAGDLADGGTLINIPDENWGTTIENLQLHGAAVEMVGLATQFPDPHAAIGIHYNAIDDDGPTFLRLDDVAFYGMDTLIQVGPIVGSGAGMQGDIIRCGRLLAEHFKTGIKVNADISTILHCDYFHARLSTIDGVAATSANRILFDLPLGGCPLEVNIYLNGNATLLKLGTHNSHYGDYRVGFQTDGNSTDVLLLDMPTAGSACSRVYLTGRMADADYAVPIIKARGSCHVVADVYNLRAGSIDMVGELSGSNQRYCTVVLRNCGFNADVTTAASLIGSITGPIGSCKLVIENCHYIQRTDGATLRNGEPFADFADTNKGVNSWAA